MLGISSACSRPWLMPMHQPTCDMRICHGEGELRTPWTAVKQWRTSNSAAPDTSGTLPGSFCVTMDNCLNTIELAPGWDGKNAVLMGWFDAIKFHDEKVVIVEQRMDVVDAKKKIFLEKQRIFEVGGKDMDGSARCVWGLTFNPPRLPRQNHNLAWNALNEDPDEFIMYCNKWKPEFTAVRHMVLERTVCGYACSH